MKIAINHKPVDSPWGGGNQFVEQLVKFLELNGHDVVYDLERDLTHILIIKSWPTGTIQFDIPEIEEYKRKHPRVKVIHRINECDQRKETDHVDELLKRANKVADITIFISNWLKEYFMARWFDPKKPYQVIYNGADPKIFYPNKNTYYSHDDKFRVVTHHWSNHWLKGFKVYQEVDRMIAEGELEGFSLMVIGRWPSQIKWRSAETHPPLHGEQLANLLRTNHLYLTASLWEPCGMHQIEGVQCGLPLVYHEDGGGIVEYGRRYGLRFRNDIKTALIKAKHEYPRLREKVLDHVPTGTQMCQNYLDLLIKNTT